MKEMQFLLNRRWQQLVQAEAVGTFTRQVIDAVLKSQSYPQLAFDKCFGILSSLRRKYGDKLLEAAAEYAVKTGLPSYRFMKAALESPQLISEITVKSWNLT